MKMKNDITPGFLFKITVLFIAAIVLQELTDAGIKSVDPGWPRQTGQLGHKRGVEEKTLTAPDSLSEAVLEIAQLDFFSRSLADFRNDPNVGQKEYTAWLADSTLYIGLHFASDPMILCEISIMWPVSRAGPGLPAGAQFEHCSVLLQGQRRGWMVPHEWSWDVMDGHHNKLVEVLVRQDGNFSVRVDRVRWKPTMSQVNAHVISLVTALTKKR